MSEGPYKLPKGWKWVKLGEVASRDSTIIRPSDFPHRTFDYLGMELVAPDQWDEPQLVQVLGAELKSQVIAFRPGYVLYGKLRPYLNKVVVPSKEGIASTEFVPIVPKTNALTPEYLGAFLRSPFFVSYASQNTTGSRQPRVRMDALWDAFIPLPPLEEQRRIVARIEELMGRIREARRLREEAKQEAERLWQAALAETFPRPGSPLPPGWRWVCIAEVVSNLQPGFAFGKNKVVNGDLLHIRPFNIDTNGELDLSQKVYIPSANVNKKITLLEPGDILFNNTNSVELVGKTARIRVPLKAAWSNHITRLRPDASKCDSSWLALSLQALWIQGYFARNCNKWIGQAGFNTESLKATKISLPPLEEQRRIVNYLEAVHGQIKALKETQLQTESVLKKLEQAILDRAFRGEL